MYARVLVAGVSCIAALAGCASPGGSGSTPSVQSWVEKAPVGTRAVEVSQKLGESGFRTWSSGRVLYASRDAGAPIAEQSGVTLQMNLGPDERIVSTEAFGSTTRQDLLLPVYP